MQTHLWCTRCTSTREVELQLKKMRGRTKLAQLISVCPKCHSTLHTQTTSLENAEDAMSKFAELKEAAKKAAEGEASEGEKEPEEAEEKEQPKSE